jgi:hypothetical protein
VKYADDSVTLATEKTVLQGTINRLTEIEKCYGMEINMDKTKVMRISNGPFPLQITVDQKQLEYLECFSYLGSMITNYARCTHEIKSRTATAKAAFNKKKTLLTSKLDLNVRKNK